MTSATQEKLTRRYTVRGRVQGVGFRWFVEREAQMLGLTGWVRNNSENGNVEVLATGTREQLGEFHQRLARGPRAARVDGVDVADTPAGEALKNFRIEGA